MTIDDSSSWHGELEPLDGAFREVLDLVDEAVDGITDAKVDERLRQVLAAAGLSGADTAAGDLGGLLRQLERRFGWGVDWSGEPYAPTMLFWPVRLRRPSLIVAVQAVAAGALSERGVSTVVCFDDLHVPHRRQLMDEFTSHVRHWMRRVHSTAEPNVVSLQDFAEIPTEVATPGDPVQRPTPSQPVEEEVHGQRSASLAGVAAAIKTRPHRPLPELEQQFGAIVQELLSKDDNRLLTPLTMWGFLHHLLLDVPASEVMVLGSSNERLLWAQWREHFGLGGTLLYHPRIPDRANEPRVMRWSSSRELRAHLARARQMPGWDEGGGYMHWMVQNAFLLPRYLARQGFPEVGGHRLDSWAAFAAALKQGAPVLDVLADEVSAFYLP